VSEWLLFNANSAIFSTAMSWREQVNFQWDDDEVRLVLDQHAKLDFYSTSSLKHDNKKKMCSYNLWLINMIKYLS
jgi:hypothetical protein